MTRARLTAGRCAGDALVDGGLRDVGGALLADALRDAALAREEVELRAVRRLVAAVAGLVVVGRAADAAVRAGVAGIGSRLRVVAGPRAARHAEVRLQVVARRAPRAVRERAEARQAADAGLARRPERDHVFRALARRQAGRVVQVVVRDARLADAVAGARAGRAGRSARLALKRVALLGDRFIFVSTGEREKV